MNTNLPPNRGQSPSPAHSPGATPRPGAAQHPRSAQPSASSRGPFLPLLLLIIAFLSWTVVQSVQLLSNRQSLADTVAQQAAPLEAAHKIRVAADSLASKMQALADKGNPNAQAVVLELKKRGVTINPKAITEAPP